MLRLFKAHHRLRLSAMQSTRDVHNNCLSQHANFGPTLFLLILPRCMEATLDNSDTQAELAAIEQELGEIEEQITDLKCRRIELQELRDSLLVSLSSSSTESSRGSRTVQDKDYGREDFSWSQDLRRLARTHWNITSWRDKQLHVMNAALDGRDTFVLMPTGIYEECWRQGCPEK